MQYYFRSTDGIGGAKTNSKKIADAIVRVGGFVPCDAAEYRKAIRAAERLMHKPPLMSIKKWCE